MSKFTHLLLQILGTVVSFGTLISGVLPASEAAYVVLAVSLAQAVLAFLNHGSAPAVK